MDNDLKNTVELLSPHTVELPPPPYKAAVPPPPFADEPQVDSLELETAEPPLPDPYPRHQLIVKRRKSRILVQTLFCASVGFGLGILIGISFLLS